MFKFITKFLDLFRKDDWSFAKDKQGHLSAGIGWAALLLIVGAPLICAVCGVALIALAKETYDYFHRDVHTPSVADFMYTVVGGIIGVVATVLMVAMFGYLAVYVVLLFGCAAWAITQGKIKT